MSTIEGFHCIQDTSLGPQGVHNGGAPLYHSLEQHRGNEISETKVLTWYSVGVLSYDLHALPLGPLEGGDSPGGQLGLAGITFFQYLRDNPSCVCV